MATEIPNLWPVDAIKVDVRTPYDILRAQSGQLQQASQGLLQSALNTTETEKDVLYSFDIVAPLLANYRHTIMTVQHSADMPYPAEVRSIADLSIQDIQKQEKQSVVQSRNPSMLSSFGDGTRVLERHERLMIRPEVYNEDDFIEKVSLVLRSDKVIALIQSLIARSRERTVIDSPTSEG